MTLAAHRRPPYESIASTTRDRRRERCAARCIAARERETGGAQVTSPTNPAAQGAHDDASARRSHDSRGPVPTG